MCYMICNQITNRFDQNNDTVEIKFIIDKDLSITTEFNLHIAKSIVSLFYNSRDQTRLERQINHTDNYNYSDFRSIISCTVISYDDCYDQCSGMFVIDLHDYHYSIGCSYYNCNELVNITLDLTIDQLIEIVQLCCQLIIKSNYYFYNYIDKLRLQRVVKNQL